MPKLILWVRCSDAGSGKSGDMKKYFFPLLRKVFNGITTLFFLICIIFLLLRLAPGNPVHKFVSPEFSPELSEKIYNSFNLNAPLHEQFLSFLANIISLNFGISYIYHQPVFEVIMNYFPFTLMFAFIVFFIQTAGSIVLSLYSFKKKNCWQDRFFNEISLIIYSIPTFVLAVLLILFFSVWLQIFPSAGITSFNPDENDFFLFAAERINYLFLPVMTLSIIGTAYFYRYLRENMDMADSAPFTLLLKSNGLSRDGILIKHILPNSVFPLISVAGIEIGMLLSGALITETIFALPGMGRLTVSSILQRDYPLVTGCAFVSGLCVILSNIAADFIKSIIDSRIAGDLIE